MRNPNRIPQVLEEIKKIWEKYPDMRLGQLIGNVLEGPSLYYVEDDGLVQALKDMYEGEHKTIDLDTNALIFDIIKKHPHELGFVLQSTNYKAYIETYLSCERTDPELTEPEFLAVKEYFEGVE